MNSILDYLWYPATLPLAILVFSLLLTLGVPTALAAYLPVFMAGITVVVLERYFPERLLWRPHASDIKADVAFLALIQVILPRLFALVTAIALSTWMHSHAHMRIWPQTWPLAAQIVRWCSQWISFGTGCTAHAIVSLALAATRSASFARDPVRA